jgi:hypothetical protein
VDLFPALVFVFMERGDLEEGRSIVGGIPGPDDTVAFNDGPCLGTNLGRNSFRVRDLFATSVTTKAPAVKGAPNRVALNAPTNTEMCAEMRTKGVHHARLASLTSPGDELAIEIANGMNLAALKIN